MHSMPQEIQVWYILPAIRRELAKVMISKGLTQKRTSELLKVTDAAVSQYVKHKRANEVDFGKDSQKHFEQAAVNIIASPEAIYLEVNKLLSLAQVTNALCQLHLKQDKELTPECRVCFE